MRPIQWITLVTLGFIVGMVLQSSHNLKTSPAEIAYKREDLVEAVVAKEENSPADIAYKGEVLAEAVVAKEDNSSADIAYKREVLVEAVVAKKDNPPACIAYKGEVLVEAVVAKEDNLLWHKSCLRNANNSGYDCRDCGANNNNSYSSRNDCPLLKPLGWCRVFPAPPWNTPPRQESYFDPTKRGHSHVIRHWDKNNVYEQIPCETHYECWDYSRCADSKVTVFAYGVNSSSSASILVDKAVAAFPEKLERVHDPQQACLLVVTPQSFDSENITMLLSHPAYGDGSNHFIWIPHRAFLQHGDEPFNYRGNYGKASLGTPTLMHSQLRPGHDVPLALSKQEYSVELSVNKPDKLPTVGKRKILLLFKGNIFYWNQIWWQHRYLAAEYWDLSADVVADVTCEGREYKIPAKEYALLLASSVFTFCPGGGSTNSFRFVEALGMGSIPIVMTDFVPPFWPDYDWSGCLLEVTEARIIDLPRRVRKISVAEIRQRQERCAELFHLTIGWARNDEGRLVDSEETSFVTALHVWIWRIQRRKEQRGQIELERKKVMNG
jgi:hypothetical protein